MDLGRVGRQAPFQPSVGIDRSFCERHRRRLLDTSLYDGSRHMVAGSEELAPQSYCELGIAFCADQLGSAQRARILVLYLCSAMGNLGDLFFFSPMV